MQKNTIYILLVEDSPSDAKLLHQIFLHADKYELKMQHVERLSQAINASLTGYQLTENDNFDNSSPLVKFDLVLLDLGLPDSLGLETLKEYRAAVTDIPVVVLTGMDDEELAMQALAEGAQDYLVKDQITVQRLVRAIRYAIEREEILNKLRESEELSRKALAKEQQLNELKSNFVAMVSHEFRNPMTIVRTAMDILQNNAGLTEDRKSFYFDRVQDSINHMLQLLDEILFLSRSEAAKLEYKPALLDLVNFCEEITESFQMQVGDQYNIILNFAGECTSAYLDEELLHRILGNLMSNAIKYSPPLKNIWLNVSCRDNMATFKVRDEGIGIPEKDQNNLFQTFYRASNVRRIQGTGLGLAMVQKCVDLHGGQIYLESQQNVGTTVTVILPLNYRVGNENNS
ncbi:HAMP domain-containing sensor histidine kinase [Nostoc sp. FACHB-110]|uniref:hybrid sensor histidine kinase/response regulator n=1 Tax=Nostoc sp. FACHB-110 TaxID=2692834 RepID=UPI001685C27B|nr:HAMP domain-containing sensor histidine kinase [Nostoc sp. FACHB-110]MBD2437436.1 HAMP domain-containing histidine kinase [Nostoc sp. FACHB-110]